MGMADAVTKKYLQDNEVFSDVFNYRLFNGKPVIRAENLSEMDPSEILVLSGKKQKGKRKRLQTKNMYRDLMKDTVIRRDQNAVYRLRLGTELQTHVHYAMPVRNQLYDAIEYYNQMEEMALRHRAERSSGEQDFGTLDSGAFLSGFQKEDRLIPVFTLTIHFGPEPWDGPLSLHDMMEVKNPEIMEYIQDYRIHLIEPAGLNRTELEKFQSSFREVMGCIKYSEDEKALEGFMKDNPRMNMDIRAARVIGTMTGTDIEYSEEKEGKINMCKAIEDMMRHSQEKGHKEGIVEGQEKGRTEERQKILDLQARMVKAGRMRAEDVAESLGVSVETVLAAAGKSDQEQEHED